MESSLSNNLQKDNESKEYKQNKYNANNLLIYFNSIIEESISSFSTSPRIRSLFTVDSVFNKYR
jgi:hypothetical protein